MHTLLVFKKLFWSTLIQLWKKRWLSIFLLTFWNFSLQAKLAVLDAILPGTDKPSHVSHTSPATQITHTHSQISKGPVFTIYHACKFYKKCKYVGCCKVKTGKWGWIVLLVRKCPLHQSPLCHHHQTKSPKLKYTDSTTILWLQLIVIFIIS